MKKTILLLIGLTSLVFAEINMTQEQMKFKTEIKKWKAVQDTLWYQENNFQAGVFDNGRNRDGYAESICLEMVGRDLFRNEQPLLYPNIFGKYESINIYVKNITNMKTLGYYECKKSLMDTSPL